MNDAEFARVVCWLNRLLPLARIGGGIDVDREAGRVKVRGPCAGCMNREHVRNQIEFMLRTLAPGVGTVTVEFEHAREIAPPWCLQVCPEEG